MVTHIAVRVKPKYIIFIPYANLTNIKAYGIYFWSIESSEIQVQALNFSLEGAHKFSSGKGHFYQEDLYFTFSKGTTEDAPGTMAIAVGAVSYFGVCH